MARDRGLKVVISGDAKGLDRAFNQVTQHADHVEKRMDGFGRKVGGAFKVAGTAAAGALVVGLKKSVDAAIEAEKSQAKLEAQLKASGISYRAHAKEIDNVIQKTSRLSGLDDEDLSDAFTNVVRATGSVNTGLKDMAVVADLARAKHMDVAKAGELVAKVHAGNVGALKRMGIAITPVTAAQDKLKESTKHATVEQTRAAKEADKTATAQKALGELQKRVGGQAAAYGKTTAGAQDRFRVAVENLQEKIGSALLPTITKVTTRAAKFVDEMSRGVGAGGRFADKLKEIADRIRPIAKFFVDHPRLIAVAVGAWVAYRVAASAALVASRLKLIGMFAGLGPKAAAGGAVAGRSFGGAAATSAGTTFNRRAPGTFGGGKMAGAMRGAGTVLGAVMGAAMLGEIIKHITNEDHGGLLNTLRGLLPFQPSPSSGIPKHAPKFVVGPDGHLQNAPKTVKPSAGSQAAPDNHPRAHTSSVTAHAASARPRAHASSAGPTAHAAASQPHPNDIVAAIEGRADRIDRAHVPYLWGGGHGGRVNLSGGVIPMDCSGAVSAALGIDPRVSGDFVNWGSSGDGGSRGVTVYANRTHVLMKINGRFWGTSRSNPGGGAGWIEGGVPAGYLSGFTARHMAGTSDAASSSSRSRRSAPSGEDFARRAGRRLAPIMRPFERAAGLEGRAARGAASALETVQQQEGTAERVFGLTDEDLNTVPGRINRVFELTSQRTLANRRLGLQKRQAAAKRRQITIKRQEIARLAAQLKRGSKHDRPEIRRRISKLQADIRQLKSEIRQLGFDIQDSEIDVADLTGQITKVQAGPETPPEALTGTAAIPGADAYLGHLDRETAEAELTPDTADDLDVAKRTATAKHAIYDYMKSHGFSDADVAAAARDAKSADDAVTGIQGTTQDNTDALKALTDELKRQNDFAASVANVSMGQLARSLADFISGQITGTGYDPRAMTAGAGALARY